MSKRIASVLTGLVVLLSVMGCPNLLLDRITQDVEDALAATAPVVTETNPPSGEEDIATDTTVWAVFSVSLDAATVTNETVLLHRGDTAVPGSVTWDAELRRATFTPDGNLEPNTTYTATITTGVTNIDGVAMAEDHVWSFVTYLANPDEIVLNLSYAGPYELSADYPVYLKLYPHPMAVDTAEEVEALAVTVRVNTTGSVVVDVDDLSPSDDGVWVLNLIHDLDGNWETSPGADGVDTEFWYADDGADNLTPDAEVGGILLTTLPSPITFAATARLAPASAYTLELTDPVVVTPDAAEPDGSNVTASTVALNTALTRTMGWNDQDWFAFTAPRTDTYRFAAATDVSDPDNTGALGLDFGVYLVVLNDELYSVGGDSDGSYGLVDASLTSGETYYILAEGVQSHDTGDYKLKVIYREALADADEDEDDLPSTAPAIGFGPASERVKTLQKSDTDLLLFTLPTDGSELPTNVGYLFSVVKPAGSVRDLTVDLEILVYNDPGNPGAGATNYGVKENVDLSNATLAANLAVQPVTEVHVRVFNDSTMSGMFQPTGGYEISILAGPDNSDYNYSSLPGVPLAAGQDDDAWDAAKVAVDLSIADAPRTQTIWPAGDEDWTRFFWDKTTYPDLTVHVTEPTGVDDLQVQIVFYNGDGSTAPSLAYTYDVGGGDPDIELTPAFFSDDSYVYMKLLKSTFETTKTTGAYALEITEP